MSPRVIYIICVLALVACMTAVWWLLGPAAAFFLFVAHCALAAHLAADRP